MVQFKGESVSRLRLGALRVLKSKVQRAKARFVRAIDENKSGLKILLVFKSQPPFWYSRFRGSDWLVRLLVYIQSNNLPLY